MKTAQFQLDTLTCPTCVKKIETAVAKQPGVTAVRVLFHSSKVTVQAESDAAFAAAKQAIERLGYPVLSSSLS